MGFSLQSAAQKEAENWLFGDRAWVNFSGAVPVSIASPSPAMNVTEGCASFSDTSGNLMFYTNGITIWDRMHNPMPNGLNLHGNNSSSQSAIVVPKPGTSYGTFYLFTIDADGGPGGLKYSEVDMSLNGGLGDITVKNVSLLTPTSEKVTAVRHGLNVNDFWIVTHEWNTDKFYSFLVSAAGISATPVISAVGEVHAMGSSGPYLTTESHGYLKASPDGSKIASAIPGPFNSRVEIFDFNNVSGALTNPVKLFGMRDPYGIEFSPSGQFLYVALLHINDTVLQFDVTSANIAATKQVIGLTTGIYLCAMQLAPNGKIYISQLDDSALAVINNPNAAGMACDFNVNALMLSNKAKQGLPNFFTNVFLNADFVYQDTCYQAATTFSLTYSGADSARWTFGDPLSGVLNTELGDTAEHVFTSPGNYTVECIVYDLGLTDTVIKTITINPLPFVSIGPDTSVCTDTPINFTVLSTNATSFAWSNLSTGNTISHTAVTSGTEIIWVDAFLNGCVMRDSVQISVYDAPVLDLGADTVLCGLSQYLLDANSALNTNITGYVWQDGSTQQTYTVDTSGLYIVTIEGNGCNVTDSIAIEMNGFPVVVLGNDSTLCEGENIWIPVQSDAVSLLWYNGSTTDSILFSAATAGNYFITVEGTTEGCTSSDELQITVNAFPASIFLGDDITACEGDAITLTSPLSGIWQDGTFSSTYTPVQTGLYSINVTQNNCSTSDSVFVTFEDAPSSFPDTDTTVCNGDIVVLDLSSNPLGFYYQWGDGFPDPIRVLTAEGSYSATVVNGNCSASSTYILHIASEPEIFLGEDSIVCFGGSLTLNAYYPYSSYLWQDGSTEPFLSTSQTATYGVQVSNQCGVFVDSISLEYVECRCNIYFPTAFTPNSDTKNDVYNFKYDCLEFTPELKIYNRWGTLLFKTTNPSIGWDGTFEGKEAPADAYVYSVKYTGIIDGVLQEQEKRGSFILIR